MTDATARIEIISRKRDARGTGTAKGDIIGDEGGRE